MHDIVIRGGTIVDGTGRAAFTGDVAIAGGLRGSAASRAREGAKSTPQAFW
jgi:N-acyl-D-amino-acid deacylase